MREIAARKGFFAEHGDVRMDHGARPARLSNAPKNWRIRVSIGTTPAERPAGKRAIPRRNNPTRAAVSALDAPRALRSSSFDGSDFWPSSAPSARTKPRGSNARSAGEARRSGCAPRWRADADALPTLLVAAASLGLHEDLEVDTAEKRTRSLFRQRTIRVQRDLCDTRRPHGARKPLFDRRDHPRRRAPDHCHGMIAPAHRAMRPRRRDGSVVSTPSA